MGFRPLHALGSATGGPQVSFFPGGNILLLNSFYSQVGKPVMTLMPISSSLWKSQKSVLRLHQVSIHLN